MTRLVSLFLALLALALVGCNRGEAQKPDAVFWEITAVDATGHTAVRVVYDDEQQQKLAGLFEAARDGMQGAKETPARAEHAEVRISWNNASRTLWTVYGDGVMTYPGWEGTMKARDPALLQNLLDIFSELA